MCSGFACFDKNQYITFRSERDRGAGVAGAGVSLGTLTTGVVSTSDGAGINSIFLTAASNATNGIVVTVKGTNTGLQGTSGGTIPTSSGALTAGSAGYGLCVFSTTQGGSSPALFVKGATYDGACTKVNSHVVGSVTTTAQTMVSSSGALLGGSAEVLVKAAISATTPAGNDYQDVVTFIATGTF